MTEKDSALRRSRRAKAPALLFSGRLAAEACALCRNHRAAARDRALALVGRIRVMRMRRTGRGRPGPALAPYSSSQPAGLAQSTAAGSAHFKAQLALYRPRASGRMRRPVAQNSTSCRIMHNVLVVFKLKIVDHTQTKHACTTVQHNEAALHLPVSHHCTAPACTPPCTIPCTTLALHHTRPAPSGPAPLSTCTTLHHIFPAPHPGPHSAPCHPPAIHHSLPAPHCTTAPHHTRLHHIRPAPHLTCTTCTLACTTSALHHTRMHPTRLHLIRPALYSQHSQLKGRTRNNNENRAFLDAE